jgi:transcriptional regulator with XRE-family HTH domain
VVTLAQHRALRFNVKLVRRHLGLTQRQLAERIGISTAQLAVIEQGRESVRLDDAKLLLIASALGVTVEELLS